MDVLIGMVSIGDAPALAGRSSRDVMGCRPVFWPVRRDEAASVPRPLVADNLSDLAGMKGLGVAFGS